MEGPEREQKDESLLPVVRVVSAVVMLLLLVFLAIADTVGKAVIGPQFAVSDVIFGSVLGAFIVVSGAEVGSRIGPWIGKR